MSISPKQTGFSESGSVPYRPLVLRKPFVSPSQNDQTNGLDVQVFVDCPPPAK